MAPLTTDANGRVIYLDLHHNHLSGPTPPELDSLVNLVRLDPAGNHLSGPIPPELGGLDYLERRNLSRNQLSGAISAELDNIATLVWLYLGSNQLTSSIPHELTNLDNLGWLNLGRNPLSGCILKGLRRRMDAAASAETDLADLGLPFRGVIPDTAGAASDRAAQPRHATNQGARLSTQRRRPACCR